jgi:hypothetical protein
MSKLLLQLRHMVDEDCSARPRSEEDHCSRKDEALADAPAIRVGEEAPMKYLILIHSNPATRKIWEGLSRAQRAEGLRGYAALTEDLVASGELIVSAPLADPSLAKRVLVRDGRTMTTDGPFAEVKEHLAGFFFVECESMERAIEHAARVPEAPYGVVEVRPVMDLSGFEL